MISHGGAETRRRLPDEQYYEGRANRPGEPEDTDFLAAKNTKKSPAIILSIAPIGARVIYIRGYVIFVFFVAKYRKVWVQGNGRIGFKPNGALYQ
mgnify:CR=1 FL=1